VTEPRVLGQRALNRALLQRQWLLERRAAGTASTAEALEHLIGLQAQAPLAPYVGLWSRIDGFDPQDLATVLLERRAVRTWVMRATIHLVTADDALRLWPLMHPAITAAWRGTQFARDVAGLDLDALLELGRALVEKRPRTRAELAPALAERFPGPPPDSLVYSVSYNLPVLQPTPRGVWGTTGPASITSIETWLGRSFEGQASIDDLVPRYLAAFGPATVADMQLWSRLTGLRAAFERLRPNLVTYRDERGRELFDIPGAAFPDPDTPVPVRFLPEYDNVLLSHADRARIIPPGRKIPLAPGNGARMGTILLDGMLAGEWRLKRQGGAARATLLVEPYEAVDVTTADSIEAEGLDLLELIAPDGEHAVTVREPIR
jgi:winged helix DNA-binding protein